MSDRAMVSVPKPMAEVFRELCDARFLFCADPSQWEAEVLEKLAQATQELGRRTIRCRTTRRGSGRSGIGATAPGSCSG